MGNRRSAHPKQRLYIPSLRQRATAWTGRQKRAICDVIGPRYMPGYDFFLRGKTLHMNQVVIDRLYWMQCSGELQDAGFLFVEEGSTVRVYPCKYGTKLKTLVLQRTG